MNKDGEYIEPKSRHVGPIVVDVDEKYKPTHFAVKSTSWYIVTFNLSNDDCAHICHWNNGGYVPKTTHKH